MSVAQRLVIFTRYPEPGHVKTRLIPVLGAVGAAELHCAMTRHTLAAAAELHRRLGDLDVVVRFTGGTHALMQRLYGPEWTFQGQGEGELGARLGRAVADAFADGRTQVVLIGSDCPQLTGDSLQDAFRMLSAADVVLGPAADGGYYLIGLRRECPTLFTAIPWGTSDVLSVTLREAHRMTLAVQMLPTLRDVDRAEDLVVLEHTKLATAPSPAVQKE